MTTKYIDSESFKTSFLKKYDENETMSNQLLADTFHDEINVLQYVQPKKSSFEDNLLEHSNTDTYSKIKTIASKFEEFVYADLAGNDSVKIEQKKNSELFVLDVFSGSYQIPGINNFLDCTGPQSDTTIKQKFKLYNQDSPTFIYSCKFNCDELLFSYFKKTKVERIKKDIVDDFEEKKLSDLTNGHSENQIYNNLVNCFWEKLIEIVECLLFKDEVLIQEEYNLEDLEKAIEILKQFKFQFNTDNFKLNLLYNSETVQSAEWIPTQKLLARKILNLCNYSEGKKRHRSEIPTPNVQPRGKDDELSANHDDEVAKEFIAAIESYFLQIENLNIKILVLSLCKFLGDTSHIVMTYILLYEIKNASVKAKELIKDDVMDVDSGSQEAMDVDLDEFNRVKELKINLQLSERPMLIRNCLPDDDILSKFEIEKKDLDSLIILVKKMVKIDEFKGTGNSSGVDNKICWSYTNDSNYNNKIEKQFLICLIEKLIDKENEDIIKEFKIIEGKEVIKDFFNEKIIEKLINVKKYLEETLEINEEDGEDEQFKKYQKLKPILEELNDLCNAKKFIKKYEKEIAVNLIEVEKILTTVNNQIFLSFSKFMTARGGPDKSLRWDLLFTYKTTPTREKLSYFEDLLNYNECIQLIINPSFFRGQEYNYNKNPELLKNSEILRKVINNEKNSLENILTGKEMTVEHISPPEINSNTYKLQKLLEHIIKIIPFQSGGTKRVLDDKSDNISSPPPPKKQNTSLKDDILYPKIENSKLFFNIATFIENSIDIFINETKEYVNLYLYCDFDYINLVIRNVNINKIIKKKIKLYLDTDEKNIYKDESYGNHKCGPDEGEMLVKDFFNKKVDKLSQVIINYMEETRKLFPYNFMKIAENAMKLLAENDKDDMADLLTNLLAENDEDDMDDLLTNYPDKVERLINPPKVTRKNSETSVISIIPEPEPEPEAKRRRTATGKQLRTLRKDKHNKKKSIKKRKIYKKKKTYKKKKMNKNKKTYKKRRAGKSSHAR